MRKRERVLHPLRISQAPDKTILADKHPPGIAALHQRRSQVIRRKGILHPKKLHKAGDPVFLRESQIFFRNTQTHSIVPQELHIHRAGIVGEVGGLLVKPAKVLISVRIKMERLLVALGLEKGEVHLIYRGQVVISAPAVLQQSQCVV